MDLEKMVQDCSAKITLDRDCKKWLDSFDKHCNILLFPGPDLIYELSEPIYGLEMIYIFHRGVNPVAPGQAMCKATKINLKIYFNFQ
jgi:hypothetical protein